MANDYWVKKLGGLVGGEIVTAITDGNEADYENFVGLQVKLPNGNLVNVWLLSDEEGNAPGRFEIEDPNKPSFLDENEDEN